MSEITKALSLMKVKHDKQKQKAIDEHNVLLRELSELRTENVRVEESLRLLTKSAEELQETNKQLFLQSRKNLVECRNYRCINSDTTYDNNCGRYIDTRTCFDCIPRFERFRKGHR